MNRNIAAATSGLLVLLTMTTAYGQSPGVLHDEREVHLADVRQMTFGGENAEAYWSPDGTELVFQRTYAPYDCDQIFKMPVSDPAAMSLVSTGTGRTTCGYYTADSERIIFSSTHASSESCPAVPDFSRGYVWPIYPEYQLYSANPDGSDLKALTDTPYYDAEATVCSVDGSIIFTSTRDGDLDLYRMDADGSNVKRLTDSPGYDGGAFFSRDCSKIVWRASRPTGDALADYQALLKEGMIRPSKLEIYVANADGTDARQVTYVGGANFAPFFYPDGERIIFSSNHHDPSGREFDIFAINVDGTALEQITYTEGFDGFPMFSPDGQYLAFGSNRNQGKPGETDVYVARWVDGAVAGVRKPADRYRNDVAWLSDDARGGRGIGSEGLAQAADWLEDQFAQIGLEPAADDGSYRHRFEAIVDVERGEGTTLSIDGQAVAADDFMIPGFSANGSASGEAVFAGWGIESEEHGINDYSETDVSGKIALVRRFTPKDGAFEDDAVQRRFGDIRYKAFKAREQGAIALLVADIPADDEEEEPPFPALRVDAQGDAGIPVAVIRREDAKKLLAGGKSAGLNAELIEISKPAENIVGRISPESRLAGAVMIGAHYDHLGFGGDGSLEPNSSAPHNGADDNASGTAALLEAARLIVASRDTLSRDVVFVAFSGEESGLLGSSELARSPLPGTAPAGLVAMLNLDMVGRLRNNRVSVLGGDSAEEWRDIVPPVCEALAIECQLGGDGYGPSDQTPFYAAGVPVLHFFTGAHEDYHKPTDDIGGINAGGGARIANVVADVAIELTSVEGITYMASEAPPPLGDVRGYGASLGTIPDYTGAPDDKTGMLLAGVREGGPAHQAGLMKGDRVVELAGREVRDIYDLMYILREAKPGETGNVIVERGDQRIESTVTFGKSSQAR
ncbi:MAG: M28 family peptidase [Gammaproteobacteria bacterium]|nr:M28 family peptidase [Gammaproteobacteria bacterium]